MRTSWRPGAIRTRKIDWVGLLLAIVIGFMCILGFVLACIMTASFANAADNCTRFSALVVRESQAVHGPNAPAPRYMAQIAQESGCRPDITAWDNGRGLAQFMDGTAKMIPALCPGIGPVAPYDPRWAVRAMICYDVWLGKRVQGMTECQSVAAALKGYNAGLGYVQQAQTKSSAPGQWFGLTEFILTRQSPINFEFSRTYPRKILFQHQPKFRELGRLTCVQGEENVQPN